MNKRVLALAVAGACVASMQASAHELAFSKTEQIKVIVEGKAKTWCKPQLELTISRPIWDSQKPLDSLLPKLPFILGQECPNAAVTWQAVDAAGAIYASGSGNSSNLGLANLAVAPPAEQAEVQQSTAQISNSQAQAQAQAVGEQAKAPAPSAEAPTVAQAESAEEPVIPTEVVDAPPPLPEVQKQALVPTIAVTDPAPDFGRSLLIPNRNLAEVIDHNGCKWIINRRAVESRSRFGGPEALQSFFIETSPAALCPNGYAQGVYERIKIGTRNTSSYEVWRNVYLHPSGLMFSKEMGELLKDRAVAFVSPEGNQALFKMGEIVHRGMTVYLAHDRHMPAYWPPYTYRPYVTVLTNDGSFALHDAEYTKAVSEIFSLLKKTYRGQINSNLFITSSLEALYPQPGHPGDTELQFVSNKLSEKNGQMIFDPAAGRNWAKQQAYRRAQFHAGVLREYESLREDMIKANLSEAQYAASKLQIINRMPSPLEMMKPDSRAQKMVIKVEGRDGDHYAIGYPGKASLYANSDLEPGWYILPAVPLSASMNLKDGKVIKAFKGYVDASIKPCVRELCADVLSLNAIVATKFGETAADRLFDWSKWTPEASRKLVEWETVQTSASIN